MTDIDAYLDELTRRTSTLLGEHLLALYLHGSAALEAFVSARSDVDVLGVVDEKISSSVKVALGNATSERSLACPGVGLEMSLLTLASVRSGSDAPAYELHIATEDEAVIDGTGRDGDPDLVAHLAMTRAGGIALLGPPPDKLIPPVDRFVLLRSFINDLDWAIEHHRSGYAVLNACRCLRFARTGILGSKFEGGAWALQTGVGDPSLIGTAMRRQAGSDEGVDEQGAAAFVRDARIRLVAAE
jgi:hypothetical protein